MPEVVGLVGGRHCLHKGDSGFDVGSGGLLLVRDSNQEFDRLQERWGLHMSLFIYADGHHHEYGIMVPLLGLCRACRKRLCFVWWRVDAK